MSLPLQRDASLGAGSPAPAPLLQVQGLAVRFRQREHTTYAVNGVDLSVRAGQTVAVLGESGCGKSVTAQAIMGILPPTAQVSAGSVRLQGQELLGMPEKRRRRLRGAQMAMVFQDALTALNPVMSVGAQIAEMFRVHQRLGRRESRRRAVELLDQVRIPDAARRARDYPHQFSGGMRQRAMIAMAIALRPPLLIADEPTTALDVTVQQQILHLLVQLQRELGMGLLLITHDLAVVAQMADQVEVMYAGQVVESAPVGSLYAHPCHPYTQRLLASIPSARAASESAPHSSQRLPTIPGQPPVLSAEPVGCSFTPRCHRADAAVCPVAPPPVVLVGSESAPHSGRCHFAGQQTSQPQHQEVQA